jgi:hypothetical protein
MSIFGIISAIVIVSIIVFLLGAMAMAKYLRSRNKTMIEKPRTIDTPYAIHVINTAAQIYCNYNESKIIRPGQQQKQKQERQGEALQEALNLVGAAYKYFDLTDSEEGKTGGKIN